MTKLTKNIIAFARDTQGIKTYEKFQDYFNHYSSEVEGAKGLIYSKEGTLAQKEAEMFKTYCAEVERLSGRAKDPSISMVEYANDPQVKHYASAVISAMIDTVLPDTLINKIGLFTEFRFGGWGDSFLFETKSRDLFVVSKAGRSNKLAFIQKQFKGNQSLVPELRQITVGVSLYRVLAGLESLGEFVTKAIRSIETEITYEAYNTMATGLAALSGNQSVFKLGSYTRDGLISLCERVTAWNGGRKAVIVGTPLALSKVVPEDANYRYMIDSDFVKLGYVKEFGSYATLALEQVADYSSANYGLKLADNQLYIISPSADKLVKVAMEGDTLSYIDGAYTNANLEQTATINKSWATGMITSALAGIVTLS